MKILIKNKWKDGFLDYYKSNQEYRIKILAFKNLEKLENVYFIRKKSLKTIYNYSKRFGIKAVARKTLSRLKESLRNEKYISCGIGKIIEIGEGSFFQKDEIVAFIAPLHPPLIERIVLPRELIFKLENFNFSFLEDSKILYLQDNLSEQAKWWQPLKAWSFYSGKSLKKCCNLKEIKQQTIKELKNSDWEKSKQFSASNKLEIEEFIGQPPKIKNNKAILFGWGHYAKTNIYPNIKPIEIVAVHEIDPLQIAPFKNKKTKINYWDTSPFLRDFEKEKYSVYFIAGFHHTHAPLAEKALKEGAVAVVEKPITTETIQLKRLLEALKTSKGKLFSAFHKRYSPLNKFILKDLKRDENTPISYHSIVYEVPLPEFHWYRWPNSKSSIITNGCHWIDQFLFLNNFSEPKNLGISTSSDKSTTNAWIELKNGAFFTMAITDKGSEYLGVRDYVELRTKEKTAKIIDDSIYIAEGKSGVIRKEKINKMENYKTMYQTIAKKIITSQSGDSIKSLEVSSGTILLLEEKLNQRINNSFNPTF